VTLPDEQPLPPAGDGDEPLAKRYGWPAKVTAVGFIVVIAFGNFWLAHALFGTVVPEWVGLGFIAGMAAAAFGGIAIVGGAAWRWLEAFLAARNL